jgi:hypothetical protein
MKKYILILGIISHLCLIHASVKIKHNNTPKHLQILYEKYKELEHAYALNLYYSGTQYEYKPEQRSAQIILENLAHWNGLIRSRLENKSHFNEEEIELVKTLQIYQKEAQILTLLCKKYTQWRHDHCTEHTILTMNETRERNSLTFEGLISRSVIEADFDEELQQVRLQEQYSQYSSLDPVIPKHHEELLNDYPELIEFEAKQYEETELRRKNNL